MAVFFDPSRIGGWRDTPSIASKVSKKFRDLSKTRVSIRRPFETKPFTRKYKQ
jgi:hypothetical protein